MRGDIAQIARHPEVRWVVCSWDQPTAGSPLTLERLQVSERIWARAQRRAAKIGLTCLEELEVSTPEGSLVLVGDNGVLVGAAVERNGAPSVIRYLLGREVAARR